MNEGHCLPSSCLTLSYRMSSHALIDRNASWIACPVCCTYII
jgi:hypothetical protein